MAAVASCAAHSELINDLIIEVRSPLLLLLLLLLLLPAAACCCLLRPALDRRPQASEPVQRLATATSIWPSAICSREERLGADRRPQARLTRSGWLWLLRQGFSDLGMFAVKFWIRGSWSVMAHHSYPRRILRKKQKKDPKPERLNGPFDSSGFRRGAKCCIGAPRGNDFSFAPLGAGNFALGPPLRAMPPLLVELTSYACPFDRVTVLVDDYFPCIRNEDGPGYVPVFVNSVQDPGEDWELWPLIMEKAWAKLYGSYEAIADGQTEDALNCLTAGEITTREMRCDDPATMAEDFRWLHQMVSKSRVLESGLPPMMCSTSMGDGVDENDMDEDGNFMGLMAGDATPAPSTGPFVVFALILLVAHLPASHSPTAPAGHAYSVLDVAHAHLENGKVI